MGLILTNPHQNSSTKQVLRGEQACHSPSEESVPAGWPPPAGHHGRGAELPAAGDSDRIKGGSPRGPPGGKLARWCGQPLHVILRRRGRLQDVAGQLSAAQHQVHSGARRCIGSLARRFCSAAAATAASSSRRSCPNAGMLRFGLATSGCRSKSYQGGASAC
jgi:hypothetical protein